MKLDELREATREGFAAIDRGEYITVGAEEIDQFLDSVDAVRETTPPGHSVSGQVS